MNYFQRLKEGLRLLGKVEELNAQNVPYFVFTEDMRHEVRDWGVKGNILVLAGEEIPVYIAMVRTTDPEQQQALFDRLIDAHERRKLAVIRNVIPMRTAQPPPDEDDVQNTA